MEEIAKVAKWNCHAEFISASQRPDFLLPERRLRCTLSGAEGHLNQLFTTIKIRAFRQSTPTFLEIYPNPSYGNTTLHFNLSQSSHATIKIFDVNGREVSSMLNSTYEAGNHSLQINTASFARGIYLVQMISADGIQNGKLLLQ
ncbi:MAG: T9SS type A sorting domain-containing protein [Chitinophagales bacterium]